MTRQKTSLRHTAQKSQASVVDAGIRVIFTNEGYGKAFQGRIRHLSSLDRSQFATMICSAWSKVDVGEIDESAFLSTLFVSRLADVPDRIPKKAKTDRAKYLLFSEGLPVESLGSRLPHLGIRDARRLHIARESDLDAISNIVFRVLNGTSRLCRPQPVVDAWIEDINLVLLSPSFERLIVPLEKLRKYIGSDQDKTAAFEIDEDGCFLYWPHADAHFGWDQFLQLVDPRAALTAQQKSDEFNAKYGEAIRILREEAHLRQQDIDGLTARNLRRVEHGESPATSASLAALASAHSLSLDDYLKKLASLVR